jgi:C4-dicarboxylate transporter DctQ subunit
MSNRNTVVRWLDRINLGAGGISIGLFLGLTGLVALNVITRPFGHPIGWTEEMTRFSLVWGVMLGMALTLQEGRHIRVTVLVQRFSPKQQKIIEFFMDLIAIAVLAVFVLQGYEFAMYTRTLGEISQGALDYPIWWAEIALPIGGGLFLVRYFVKCVTDFMNIIHKDGKEQIPKGVSH